MQAERTYGYMDTRVYENGCTKPLHFLAANHILAAC
jgi:hypothetical protein